MRIAEDEDYLFVDYLGKVAEFYGLLGSDCNYIKWHKRKIEKGLQLYLEDEKLLNKYAWMMNYHHSRLASIFGTEVCVNSQLRSKVAEKLGPHTIDFFF